MIDMLPRSHPGHTPRKNKRKSGGNVCVQSMLISVICQFTFSTVVASSVQSSILQSTDRSIYPPIHRGLNYRWGDRVWKVREAFDRLTGKLDGFMWKSEAPVYCRSSPPTHTGVSSSEAAAAVTGWWFHLSLNRCQLPRHTGRSSAVAYDWPAAHYKIMLPLNESSRFSHVCAKLNLQQSLLIKF